MIGIGITKPDAGNILAVRPGIPFVKGLGPVLNIILAYSKCPSNTGVLMLEPRLIKVAGHVAFISFQSELADPRDFKKALFFEQGIAITFYMTISAVIYYYAGPLVTSPALGSASPVVTKIAFGFAIPTIIIAGVVNGSVACKYIYIRMWKGTNVVHQKSFKSLGSWYGICIVFWVVAWILAESIPNFNLLLGLIAALFGSWFSCKFNLVLATSIRLTRPRCTSHGHVVLPAQGILVQEHAVGYVVSYECFPFLHWCCNRKYHNLMLFAMTKQALVRSRHVRFR
jgi:hypothetical protein